MVSSHLNTLVSELLLITPSEVVRVLSAKQGSQLRPLAKEDSIEHASEERTKGISRRFSREKRMSMILDSAAQLIAEQGTADLSLETIGEQAGVSKTLMYRYFGSLLDLLKRLLNREYRHLRTKQLEAAEDAETYEDLVRGVTRAYLLYIEERGLIVERLQAYPNIAQPQDPTHYNREPSIHYFSEVTAEVFDIPIDIAIAGTEISFGLPAAAGDFLVRSGMDRQLIEDVTVAMILGSIAGLRNDTLGRKVKVRAPSEVLRTRLRKEPESER